MREIKFRMWDGYRMTASGIMFNTSTSELFSVGNMPIMEYTGLKDKNGEEIYEGDILQTSYGTYEIAIDWYHGIRTTWGQDTMCLAYALEGKVIGNIYENAELLDGG